MNHSKCRSADQRKNRIIISFLFPANQQSAKTIHPAMSAFYYPPSCPITRYLLLCCNLFSTCFNMGCVAVFCYQISNIRIVITFIHAHILWFGFRHFGSFYHHISQCRCHKRLVMTVGSINRYCQWDTISLCQQTTFGSTLATVSRISSDFFPHPMVLSSSLHPLLAIPNPVSLTPHTSGVLPSTFPEIHRLLPISGNGHEQCLVHQDFLVELTTDNLCVGRKILHPLPFGYPSLDAPLWVLVVLVAVVVLFAPKVDLELGILYLFRCFPLLYLHFWVNLQWILYHTYKFSDRLL